jgi:uncharacterized protein YhjY with autotransporter beta-barrel domain
VPIKTESKRKRPTVRRSWLRGALLAGAAACALTAAVPARAQTVSTISDISSFMPNLNNINTGIYVSDFGFSNTATYGQVITPTTFLQSFLTSMTFQVELATGSPFNFQTYVYQFNQATKMVVGGALFTSPVMTMPNSTTPVPLTLNTGRTQLTPGNSYIVFITITNVPNSATIIAGTNQYNVGFIGAPVYSGGLFYYQNNGYTSFASLLDSAWTMDNYNFGQDELAFTATFGPPLPPGTPNNPTNVAAALINFINNGGVPTGGFTNVYLLSGPTLVTALEQLDGEAVTQAQTGAFQMTDSFLEMLLSPLGDNRTAGFGPIAMQADEEQPSPHNSYASLGDTPSVTASFMPDLHLWGGAYGAIDHVGAGSASIGSTSSTTNAGGFAIGADYKPMPNLLLGAALGGGGMGWSLESGMGSGSADVLQTGLYGSWNYGQYYLSGAFSFGQFWTSTNRDVGAAGGGVVNANFSAQDYAGRLEGGYHLTDFAPFADIAPFTVTPYAAVQPQAFVEPAFAESSSSTFALAYQSRTATSVRTELGSWANTSVVMPDNSWVNFFGRVAWAHDNSSTPSLNAGFVSLPGAGSFNVLGAKPGIDRGVITVGAEWPFAAGLSLMARVDGEGGADYSSVKATARLRYTW